MSIRFIPTHNPDNRFKFIKEDKTQEIIIGGSTEHTFELPFIYENYIKSGKIIYKQGCEIILEEEITLDMIDVIDKINNTCSLIIKLKPYQTQRFKKTVLDTFVQLRLITKDNKVVYDNAHKLNVKEPLKLEFSVGNEE